VISTPNAENERLAEFVLAAIIAPAGKDKLKVNVAASDAGIVLPRIMKYFPLDAGEANSAEGITIKLYDTLEADWFAI
jgi:hypothetical protein